MEITSRTRGASARPVVAKPIASLLSRWIVLLVLADLVMLGVVAYLSRNVSSILLALFVVSVPMLFAGAGLYSNRLHIIVLDQMPVAVGAITLAATAVVTINFMVLDLPLRPSEVLYLWAGAAVLVPLGRLLAAPVHKMAVMSVAKRRTLIVGSGSSAVLVAKKIERHPELGLEVVGFVDNGPRKSVRGRHEPLLGELDRLPRILTKSEVEVVILAFVKNNYQEILRALYRAEPEVEILMMPRYFEFLSAGMRVDDLAGMPLLGTERRRHSIIERSFKRGEDLLLASIIALVAAPLIPLIALAIKLDSPGPVFFKHRRVGKNFKPFELYKFRSMTTGAHKDDEALKQLGEDDPRALKNTNDARVTRVGRILRKSSLDELPQIINVLKGDMSLIGPRPPVDQEVDAYDEWQKKRLSVRPGLTGLWQVSGRSDLPFDERIWLDFMYIDSWSPWLDVRILLQTIPAVISMRGAY